MIKSFEKPVQAQYILYVLLLLFTVSQSLATAADCKMVMADHDMSSLSTPDSDNPHAGHNMQPMDMKINVQYDRSGCCDLNCQCVQNSCASSNSMSNSALTSNISQNLHTLFFNEETFIKKQIYSSFFRPPIIC